MLLFKTSGATFSSVIKNQMHAFRGQPRIWSPGEQVIVSKNLKDYSSDERQIQYTMFLAEIRPLVPGEADRYWPGTEGRWRYLVKCNGTQRINKPFNLDKILGENSKEYRNVMTFKKIKPEHESLIVQHLASVGTTPVSHLETGYNPLSKHKGSSKRPIIQKVNKVPLESSIDIEKVRTSIVQACNRIWKQKMKGAPPKEISAIIGMLSKKNIIPRHETNMMHTLCKLRNVHVYEEHPLNKDEIQIVNSAWAIVDSWLKSITIK